MPDILADPASFRALSEQAQRSSNGEMKNEYSARLAKFREKFRLNVSWVDTKLDDFQKIRNAVAHDQSLDGADDPTLSSNETMELATKVSEEDWKAMLNLFKESVRQLDVQVARNVVTDGGCSLAVFRILERSTAVSLSEIRQALQQEWRIPAKYATKAHIQAVVGDLGYQWNEHGVVSLLV